MIPRGSKREDKQIVIIKLVLNLQNFKQIPSDREASWIGTLICARLTSKMFYLNLCIRSLELSPLNIQTENSITFYEAIQSDI